MLVVARRVRGREGESMFRVRYFHWCGSPWSDPQETFLTVDVSDPLDWEQPVAVFGSEAEAVAFMNEAYASLMEFHHDWKAVELSVVEVGA